MACLRPSVASAVLTAEAAPIQIQLPTVAPPDINDNMRSPSTSAYLRPLAVSPPPNKRVAIAYPRLSATPFDNYMYLSSSSSTLACPRLSVASAVLTAEAAPIQIQLPIAASPVSKRLHKSIISCIEQLLTKVEKKVKNEQQKIIEDL